MNEWSEKFLLEIDEIDKQHHGFFDLLYKELLRVDLNDVNQLKSIIKKLEDYLIGHFSVEEELMKNSGYPEMVSHVAQHKFFIQKVEEMKVELNYNNPLLFENLTGFMKKWFLGHILQTDKRYQETVKAYLNAKP